MSVGVLFTQGLVTGDPHQTLTEILDQAEAADRLGFSAALTTEHKYSDEYFGSPLHLSFAIAARTQRVQVGTAIAIAPLYNPVELAQDAAMLDQLSGGRAWLGLGVGYMPVDYSTVGVTLGRPRPALRRDAADPAGGLDRRSGSPSPTRSTPSTTSSVIPKPRQEGGVPLHLAAWTPGGLRRAGRLGDGWITNALMSLETMTAMAGQYREAAARGRVATPHVTSIRFCWPYTSREAALEKFGDTALAMARTLFDYGAITDLPGVTESSQITLEEFVEDRFVFGTPEECVETIGRFRDQAGVDDFLMIFRYPTGPDHAGRPGGDGAVRHGGAARAREDPGGRMTVRVGVVGASYAVGTHLPVYAALPDVELVAVATAHEDTARAVAERFGARPYVGFEALCADPDVDLVDIATRPSRHREMAEAALAAGKDVLSRRRSRCRWPTGRRWRRPPSAGRGLGRHAVAVLARPAGVPRARRERLARHRRERRRDGVLPDVHPARGRRRLRLVRRSPSTGRARCGCTACTPPT